MLMGGATPRRIRHHAVIAAVLPPCRRRHCYAMLSPTCYAAAVARSSGRKPALLATMLMLITSHGAAR